MAAGRGGFWDGLERRTEADGVGDSPVCIRQSVGERASRCPGLGALGRAGWAGHSGERACM